VWTSFKLGQRENPKEGSEHESERKMPKKKPKDVITEKEGGTWEDIEEG
jgi:hypothetical protein